MSKPAIGFIGLGLMGNAMVENLQARGYDLTVLANRTRAHVDAAISRGATEVSNAKRNRAGQRYCDALYGYIGLS